MVLLMPYYTHINSDYNRRNRLINYDPICEDTATNSTEVSSISISSSSSHLDSLSEYSSSPSSLSSLSSTCNASNDELVLQDEKMQLEFVTQICSQIELKLKEENIKIELNDLFWSYLSDNLNLSNLLVNINLCDTSNFRAQLDFFQNLNKLIKCLSRVEFEIKKFNNLINCDDEFTNLVFKITFLIYQNVNDVNDTQFELNLNRLVKFVPNLVNKPDEQFLKSLIEIDENCFICENPIDVGELVHKPCYVETSRVDSNPITQSYKCLIENLNALNFYTHDPFSEADELAAETGCQVDITSFACLNLSYYTMGLFELRKNLFENPFQFLYELKHFYEDFNQMFSNDTYCVNEPKEDYNLKASYFDETSWDNSTSSTLGAKWKFEHNLEADVSNVSVNEANDYSVFDDILKHQLMHSKKNFPTNNNNKHTICTNFSISKSPPDYIIEADSSKSNWSTTKTDLKPIGAKPASMFTISNRYHYKSYRKSNQVQQQNQNQQNIQHQQNQSQKNHFTQSIWKHNESKESTYISPFISYTNTLNQDEFLSSSRMISSTSTTYKPRIDSIMKQNVKVIGKHSVAPSCLVQPRQTNYRNYQSNNSNTNSTNTSYRSKPSKTVYHSDVYHSLYKYKKTF